MSAPNRDDSCADRTASGGYTPLVEDYTNKYKGEMGLRHQHVDSLRGPQRGCDLIADRLHYDLLCIIAGGQRHLNGPHLTVIVAGHEHGSTLLKVDRRRRKRRRRKLVVQVHAAQGEDGTWDPARALQRQREMPV